MITKTGRIRKKGQFAVKSWFHFYRRNFFQEKQIEEKR
jgi:hypothetical protein